MKKYENNVFCKYDEIVLKTEYEKYENNMEDYEREYAFLPKRKDRNKQEINLKRNMKSI